MACMSIPEIATAYFYCQHSDTNRNSFVAVARALLAQILHQNDDLLPYIYETCMESGHVTLRSPRLCNELLQTVLHSVGTTYIILDGIDECSPPERKAIISFFTSYAKDNTGLGQLRTLIISRDEKDIEKLLHNYKSMPITLYDTESDVAIFAADRSQKIRERFGLSAIEQEQIFSLICQNAHGMYCT
jgi:hypothetical protein